MIFASCIKCRNRDFERPDKGAYLVSRKVEVVKKIKNFIKRAFIGGITGENYIFSFYFYCKGAKLGYNEGKIFYHWTIR